MNKLRVGFFLRASTFSTILTIGRQIYDVTRQRFDIQRVDKLVWIVSGFVVDGKTLEVARLKEGIFRQFAFAISKNYFHKLRHAPRIHFCHQHYQKYLNSDYLIRKLSDAPDNDSSSPKLVGVKDMRRVSDDPNRNRDLIIV